MILNENQKDMYKDCMFLNESLFKSKEDKQKERELYNSSIKEAKSNALKLIQQVAPISKQYVTSTKIDKVKVSDINSNIQSINKTMDNDITMNLNGLDKQIYFLQIALARTGDYDDYSKYNNQYISNLQNLLNKKINNENFRIAYNSDHNKEVTKDFYWFYIDYRKEVARLLKSKGLKPRTPYDKV